MFTGIFSGIVTEEFINHRDKRVASTVKKEGVSEISALRRWDSEFAEWDIVNQNIGHTIYKGFEYDTIHSEYGRCDFKYLAKNGAKVSAYPQRQIREGTTDTIVLWRWISPWKPLKLGEFISYEILHYISAKKVLANLNEDSRYVV